jgi:hypothetical protein
VITEAHVTGDDRRDRLVMTPTMKRELLNDPRSQADSPTKASSDARNKGRRQMRVPMIVIVILVFIAIAYFL